MRKQFETRKLVMFDKYCAISSSTFLCIIFDFAFLEFSDELDSDSVRPLVFFKMDFVIDRDFDFLILMTDNVSVVDVSMVSVVVSVPVLSEIRNSSDTSGNSLTSGTAGTCISLVFDSDRDFLFFSLFDSDSTTGSDVNLMRRPLNIVRGVS